MPSLVTPVAPSSSCILVEGIIGAGKTTFSEDLALALGPRTLFLPEPDEEGGKNPYLADFYADPVRWALAMQVHLLARRYRAHLQAQWHVMNGSGDAVLDRSYFGDTCFAALQWENGSLSAREIETYRGLYEAMTAHVLLPSICVVLQVDPLVAAQRIQRRAEARTGRQCERAIDVDYLVHLDVAIGRMTRVLASQGVQVLPVPWDEDRDEAHRREGAAQVAQVIHDRAQAAPGPSLFDRAYQRTMGA